MPMQLNVFYRSNVSPAKRRQIYADAALIADELEFLTGHQTVHLRPPISVMLARLAARRTAVTEVVR